MPSSMVRVIVAPNCRGPVVGSCAQQDSNLRPCAHWRLAPRREACAALIFVAALLTSSMPQRATADDPAAGRAEMQNAFAALAPRPSLDTYPVEFSVGGIQYRIPRNYLTVMENWAGGPQALVGLTVNIPDLMPLSKETLACFAAKAPDRPPGCEPFSFRVNASGGPSADQILERNGELFHSQTPVSDPSGFEEYESGPPDARTVSYKKIESGRTRLYWCHFVGDLNESHGLCQPDGDTTAAGAVIKFFFSPKHLNDIAEVDANLRKLVEGFTINLGNGNDRERITKLKRSNTSHALAVKLRDQ